MKYLDTAVLVSVLLPEDTSALAIRWMEEQRDHKLAVSEWVRTEFSAALSRKLRSRRITVHERDAALLYFRGKFIRDFHVLEIQTRDYENAASIADRHDLGVRAGDALHLAVALGNDCTLVTLDRQLAEGARALGYAVELIA
jgi:uncharacterized protein